MSVVVRRLGERNTGHIPSLTVTRVWSRARAAVFPADVVASPLAKTTCAMPPCRRG